MVTRKTLTSTRRKTAAKKSPAKRTSSSKNSRGYASARKSTDFWR